MKKQTKHHLLFLVLLVFGVFQAYTQGTFLEEDFESWTGSCPDGWACETAPGCTSGSACYWAREDSLGPAGLPDSLGCMDMGHYVRCQTSQLAPTDKPELISPIIDLSTYSDTFPLIITFCYINSSITGSDGDGIEVSFSSDSGQTWVPFSVIVDVAQSWENQEITIPDSFYSAGFRIRFGGFSLFSTGDVGIDNLELKVDVPDCLAAPSQISSTISGNICKNEIPDTAFFQTTYNGAGFFNYVLTDSINRVISVLNTSYFDMNSLPQGRYKIYGISYSGVFDPVPTANLSTSFASICEIFSDNVINFNVYELEADAYVVSDYNGFQVSKFNGDDGAARVDVANGNGLLAYVWNTEPIQSGTEATNLKAGTYLVQVLDGRGCKAEDSVTLQQPDSLVLLAHPQQKTSLYTLNCSGDEDGTITLDIEGGVPPMQIEWSNGSQDTLINGLGEGDYTVVVTDANGATETTTVTISAPAALSLSSDLTLPDCGEDSLAMIALSMSGGVSPYVYTWSDGNKDSSRNNLSSGIYNCLIIDSNGCSLEQSFNVSISDPLEITETISEVKCGGEEKGSITIEITGGTAPFDIQWGHGPQTQRVENLEAGIYDLLVMDAQGCIATKTYTIEEQSELELELTAFPDKGREDGKIRVSIRGGKAPYSFDWAHGPQTAALDDLEAGTYVLEVSDSEGCTIVDTAVVNLENQLDESCREAFIGFTPNGDGVNDYLDIPCLDVYPVNNLRIYNRWGQEVFATDNYLQNWDGTINGQPLPEDTYFFVIQLPFSGYTRIIEGSITIIR